MLLSTVIFDVLDIYFFKVEKLSSYLLLFLIDK